MCSWVRKYIVGMHDEREGESERVAGLMEESQ